MLLDVLKEILVGWLRIQIGLYMLQMGLVEEYVITNLLFQVTTIS